MENVEYYDYHLPDDYVPLQLAMELKRSWHHLRNANEDFINLYLVQWSEYGNHDYFFTKTDSEFKYKRRSRDYRFLNMITWKSTQ